MLRITVVWINPPPTHTHHALLQCTFYKAGTNSKQVKYVEKCLEGKKGGGIRRAERKWGLVKGKVHQEVAKTLDIYTYIYILPREGTGTPLQYSRLENPMNGGAWWAAVHGVAKSWTQLSDFTFTFHFHALEKEMATHSSVLAWRIPGTEEPGRRPSMGLRVYLSTYMSESLCCITELYTTL